MTQLDVAKVSTLGLREFLNDGLNGAALEMSRRSAWARLAATGLVAGLLAYHFAAAASLTWLAVIGVLEGLLLFLHRWRQARPDWQAPLLVRLGAPALYSMAWATMAALSWAYGPPTMKFAALLLLFGLMVDALKYAALSRSVLLAMAPPPFIALTVAPLLAGGFKAWDRVVVAVTLAALLVYLLDTARMLRSNALALEKAQAEAQEANRAKSAFVAMMSHELRTPMNGVLGLAHALSSTRLDARQADYLEMIIQSGDGLMTILNDILDLSKVEAGKLELEAEPFEIRRLASQIHLVWSQTAQLKGLALTLDVAPETPAWLLGDPLRVRQILLNLVSNALKFTEAGRVEIRIAPGEAGGVDIVVADTGVGLSVEQQVSLFSPFSQGDRSTARRFGGTGLGLAISRHLAQLMGGEITVTSALGQGSTFRVHLALTLAQAPAALEPAGLSLTLEGTRVLVVDDNQVNQAVARAILETVGIIIATADDGRQALARLRIEDFDVVLMDVHMPEMDGVEAVRRIRAGEGGRVDIPILALTADAMVGEAQRLLAQGFDDAHPKPIQPAGLLAAVARMSRYPAEPGGRTGSVRFAPV
ncbi:ATP-binding protein [Caulobacter sp. ErkDOM-YI]|uniref:ATP-binding protein n=1 Tax=unclassified Caulobacter TaxID=2648921 RepID=UPI003AF481AC